MDWDIITQMTQEAAERFATALLIKFSKEGVFQFELPEGHNLELVTASLRRKGCIVDNAPGSTKVTVRVPNTKVS